MSLFLLFFFIEVFPKHDLSFHTVSFLRLCNFNHLYRSETDLVFQDHIVSQLFLKRLLIKTWSIFPSFSGSQWFSPPKACLIVIQTVAVRSSDGTLCWGTKGGTGWGGRYLLWHLWSSDAICFFFDNTQETEAWSQNLPRLWCSCEGQKSTQKSQKKTCHNSMSIMLYSVMLIITMKYYLKCNLFTFI